MGFKLGSEKRKIRTPQKTPILKKKLDKGILAEANKDSTIFIDSSLKDPKIRKYAVDHEREHIEQIKKGDLNYDNKNVYWKGQTIARAELEEGNSELPWEKPIYEQVKKS